MGSSQLFFSGITFGSVLFVLPDWNSFESPDFGPCDWLTEPRQCWSYGDVENTQTKSLKIKKGQIANYRRWVNLIIMDK